MNVKEKIIEMFDLKFEEETKWNHIYKGNDCTMIFNKTTKDIKIKPKY